MCSCRNRNCLFRLLRSIVSRSTMWISPKPAKTRFLRSSQPIPPAPTMKTRDCVARVSSGAVSGSIFEFGGQRLAPGEVGREGGFGKSSGRWDGWAERLKRQDGARLETGRLCGARGRHVGVGRAYLLDERIQSATESLRIMAISRKVRRRKSDWYHYGVGLHRGRRCASGALGSAARWRGDRVGGNRKLRCIPEWRPCGK